MRVTSVDAMRWTDALLVGCAQAFALVPGTSRSGATIIGGMLFGLSRVAATEFSFFLAIPTLFAATGYSLWKDASLVAAARSARVRRRLRGRVRLGIRVRAVADPLREPSRLRALRVVSDRFRRSDPRDRVRGRRALGLTATPRRRWVGPLYAVLGVLGFSFKAILIKLAYATYPVDAVTLLALRMLYAAPFFAAMAWWAARRPRSTPPFTRDDWKQLALLGFIGYYLASLLDFMGLQYITAALERLVLFLYPTMVVVLSAFWLWRAGDAADRVRAPRLLRGHRARLRRRPARRAAIRAQC